MAHEYQSTEEFPSVEEQLKSLKNVEMIWPAMTRYSEFDVSIVNQKLVLTIPELRPGSVVWMKGVPLEPYGNNVFKIAGGSVGNKFITFESGNDGRMRLNWRNYVFKRQL